MCGKMMYRASSRGTRIHDLLSEQGILKILDRTQGDSLKMTAPGMMDLSIDLLTPTRIALSHYGRQNEDSMADPDMEIEIRDGEAHAQTWQNDYVQISRRVSGETDPMRDELDEFLLGWLSNIKMSGYR